MQMRGKSLKVEIFGQSGHHEWREFGVVWERRGIQEKRQNPAKRTIVSQLIGFQRKTRKFSGNLTQRGHRGVECRHPE
jgi:hypothetical protein